MNNYQVLLYYKYVALENPEKIRDEQKILGKELGLTGRIIIAKEGINGTVEGIVENCQKYMDALKQYKEFSDINFKVSEGTGSAFPKLSIKVRPEIVTAHLLDLDPNQVTGKYLTSEELHEWFETKKEFYIVDMRNDYEYASGYFEGSIFSGLHNFYDLAESLPKLAHLKDKTVLTVCTGGVRCEKASGFLKTNGFNDVYQLKDGIHTYMEKYPNQHFKGKLYVFDNRLTLGFNIDSPDHQVVGSCYHCGVTCDTYVNCEYDVCHYHYICCNNCRDQETGLAFCKPECKELFFKIPNRRTKEMIASSVTL